MRSRIEITATFTADYLVEYDESKVSIEAVDQLIWSLCQEHVSSLTYADMQERIYNSGFKNPPRIVDAAEADADPTETVDSTEGTS